MFDLPLGFGYALAQNVRAKDYFMSKSEQEQKEMSLWEKIVKFFENLFHSDK